MTLFWRAIALSFALVSSVASAQAQGCKLTLLNSIDLTPAGPGGRMLAPVTINGSAKLMLVDTAGGLSTLTDTAAQATGLHILDGSRMKLLGGSGNASHRYVHVDNFQIGALHGEFDLMISPNAVSGPNGPIDGVLAGDFMSRYDIEMDFAGRKLNYFSPNDCNGNVVYWPAAAVAVVPLKLGAPMRTGVDGRAIFNDRDTHIRVPITLDG